MKGHASNMCKITYILLFSQYLQFKQFLKPCHIMSLYVDIILVMVMTTYQPRKCK